MQIANPQVHIMEETRDNKLIMVYEFYSASWSAICAMVNMHNDAWIAGNADNLWRVFCPWEGEELYIPKSN